MTSDIKHDQDGKTLRLSEQEKRRLEREAAKLFMRAYENQFHQPIRHIWHNEPAKPDISCYLANEPLDLEVAHLYSSEHEACLIAGNNRSTNLANSYQGEEHLWMYLSELASGELIQKLQLSLAKLLHNKAQKNYQSKRVWLIIRNASPLWSHSDFIELTANLSINRNSSPFEAIWMLTDLAGRNPLIKLP